MELMHRTLEGTLTVSTTIPEVEKILFTLQYCLETLEQSCQCGQCDPCTQGQADIREAIQLVSLVHEDAKL